MATRTPALPLLGGGSLKNGTLHNALVEACISAGRASKTVGVMIISERAFSVLLFSAKATFSCNVVYKYSLMATASICAKSEASCRRCKANVSHIQALKGKFTVGHARSLN